MRKVLGVLFVLVSAVLGTVVLLGWGIRTSLLVSDPWKASLREARVYDRLLVEALPDIVADRMVTEKVTENAPLTPNDLVTIAQRTITAPFVQTQVERGLDVVFNLLHSRTTLATETFVIPLQDIKRTLPAAIQDRLVARVQALPICAADKVKEFEKFKDLNDALPPCRPKGLDVQAIVRDSAKVDEIAANIPATFDVIAEVQKPRETTSDEEAGAQQAKDSGAAVAQQQTNDPKGEVKTHSNTNDEGAAKKEAQQKLDEAAAKNDAQQQVSSNVQKGEGEQQKTKEPSKPVAEQVATVQEKIQFGFRMHLYATLVWVLLLLGLGALFIPHWRRVAQWFAVGLFVPSAIFFAGTLVGRGMLPARTTVTDRNAQVIVDILQPAADAMVQVASNRFLILGGAGVALSIVTFTLAFAFARKKA